ncbi:hypothetical protein PUNSTDRAFT_48389 [Punctularia strigosozonata HHB-11173 SS5]|uniref:uncharacterized protein n=1 Tax=Punctularia strigosozonata (strain HHB-11173) TaxID=741275 RepID=UPI0004417414|nr:uncharacterized protein PUNSTDRAFT_48389 [Punctularia strigosozonata HHB-11173 SS5]EIN13407.1 hypothetical protein PUNSTDRAFT_48389 [Punctularia strigosozonata HHB-11173 SS5]
MRVKQIWAFLPLPAKIKLFWSRITSSRTTTFYFIFSVLHCIVQVVFQVQAFSVNSQAASFLWNIVLQGNAVAKGFTVLGKDLRDCANVPNTWSTASCEVVWNGTALNDNYGHKAQSSADPVVQAISTILSSSAAASSTASSSVLASATSSVVAPSSAAVTSSASSPIITAVATEAINSTATSTSVAKGTKTVTVVVAATAAPAKTDDEEDDDEDEDHQHDKREASLGRITAVEGNGTTTVNITGLGYTNNEVTLDRACLISLNWPVTILQNTKREDVTFIAFQFWVLGMSIVAILNESIPHIVASLLTHIAATAWGGFQIEHTRNFRDQFMRLTADGACKPIHLLPTYWEARGKAEIPSLVLNVVALAVSVLLSWRLIKSFGWQTFKRVGASLTINRVYKCVLSLSIVIQLSVFFVVASLALWIDQLLNGDIAKMASTKIPYKAMIILVGCLLLPWLMLGWFSVRREMRIPMLIFLGMSLLYLGGWGAMFKSTTFRWTFKEWRFFSIMVAASAFLVLISFVLGVICRVNFGKGLPRYLNAQEPLPGDDFATVTPGDVEAAYNEKEEKVEFPSTTGGSRPIPTFSAAFGAGAEVPPPSQMQFAPRHMGPRFNNPSAEPFDTASTVGRSSEPSEYGSNAPLTRQVSVSSVGSDRSTRTTDSQRSIGSKQRWVIE